MDIRLNNTPEVIETLKRLKYTTTTVYNPEYMNLIVVYLDQKAYAIGTSYPNRRHITLDDFLALHLLKSVDKKAAFIMYTSFT